MTVFSKLLTPRVSVSFFFFFCGLVFATWASRIPSIKDRFGFNEAELGGILFMLPLGSVSALPIAGWVIERFGSRAITTWSSVIYGILLWMLSLAESAGQLSLILFLFGFVGDLLNISMNTQGLSVQHLEQKPILSGLHAQWSFGALAGATFAGWSFRSGLTTGMHFSVVAIAVIGLSLVMNFHLIPDHDREKGGGRIYAWPGRALLLLGLICFCNTMAEGAMADWSSLYYRNVLDDMNKVSTTGYMAFTLSMTVGRLAGDRIILSLRYRKTLMVSGLLIAAGLGLAIAWPVPVAVIAGYVLVGLGVSSVIPIAYMIAGKSRSLAPAAALATVSAIGFTGFLLGPPFIGFIAHLSSLRIALLVIVALGGVIFLLSSTVKEDS
jgi:MFS family permease